MEEVDAWLKCANEHREPAEQLEVLRHGIIQDCWSEVIKNNITDELERSLHMEAGEFAYESVSMVVEPGMSKA